MLHTRVYPAGSTVTGPSSTNQHGLSNQELADLQRWELRAYQASIASARQRCRDVCDRLADSAERIARSQDILATNQEKFGRGPGEPQPLPQGLTSRCLFPSSSMAILRRQQRPTAVAGRDEAPCSL